MNFFLQNGDSMEDLSENSISIFKILEINFNRKMDSFSVDIKAALKTIVPGDKITKRLMLKFIASLYDPAGYVAPVIVKAKLILQEAWRGGLGWDDKVPQALEGEFLEWMKQIPQIESIQIPRSHSGAVQNPSKAEIHIFSDASLKLFGMVVYLVITNDTGDYHSSIIMSKSRIGPMKGATIPRLEIMGILLSAKAYSYLKKKLMVMLQSISFGQMRPLQLVKSIMPTGKSKPFS
jgi:hypothetical protein